MKSNSAKVASPAQAFRGGSVILNANAGRPFIHTNRSTYVLNDAGQMVPTRNAGLLRYQEWLDIDRTVIEASADRLVGIGDLIAGGLVHNLGSIGQTISLYQRQSTIEAASVSMSGITRGEKDLPEFDSKQVPVPIIFKDWELNLRHLEASRMFGASLDTVVAVLAGRVVAEKSEDMLFAGDSIVVEGNTIYGYTTHPDRNVVDMTEVWTAVGKTGLEILADVQAMLAAARADRKFGPFVMYIPGEYETRLDDDYDPTTGDTRTIRQRILQLQGISDIKVADRLANNNVLLVQLTRDVVDLAKAQEISTVQWTPNGGLSQEFKTMACWVPRVKSEFDGSCGVVHLYEVP